MRTTVELDEESYCLIKSYANERGRTMGWVINHFARKVVTDEEISRIYRMGRELEARLIALPIGGDE